MPFDERLKDVYTEAIEPAVKSAGYDCIRADRDDFSASVVRSIVQNIFEADAVVADLSFGNPNVFYELGIVHTIADKTVMMCSDDQRLPFDLSAYRTLMYKREQLAGLRTRLEASLRDLQRSLSNSKGATNPVREFLATFTVPYRKDGARYSLTRLLGSLDAAVVTSVNRTDGRGFTRESDGTVLHLISTWGGTLRLVQADDIDLARPSSDVVVIGSPRLNPIAEQIQRMFDLPCQYVSVRARGDAIARDDSNELRPSDRTLRIVTAHGDELSASSDNRSAHGGDGTDYGLIVFAALPGAKRLIWISGIHGKGTLGAYGCLVKNAERLLQPSTAIGHTVGTALTQAVRIKYSERSNERGLEGIDGELLGDPVYSRKVESSTDRRALLFDLGDVVMRFDRDRTYRSIGHLIGSNYQEVRGRFRSEERSAGLVSKYECGDIDTATFCDRLAAMFGGTPRVHEWLSEFWSDIFWPNYEMFEVLRFLKREHVPLGLVSNTNPLHFEQVERDYPEIIDLFDERTLSYEVNAMKPSATMFHDAIGKMRRRGVEPDRILYVDDLEVHVSKMRQLGVDGFVYRSHSHFVLWLRKHGVFVPTIADW